PMSEVQSEQRTQAESSLEIERLVFFSDAVIAIAITLMAFNIVPPPTTTRETLAQDIINLLPHYGVYALSFLIVGNYWVIHHRVFRNIRRYDTPLIWINTFFLLCVASLPVPSRIFGQYPTEQAAIIFFDVCLIITGLVQYMIWWHATRNHRLIDPNFSPALIRWGKVRSLIPPAVQVISIGLSFISPVLAVASWAFIWIGFTLHNRHFPRKA
ncbi:MAG: DUF1211 domain-containing protein, partial [Anaerolineae bacterium]|nr:DUF1211 domain-containing protein [Anaerolineae bacterium]